MNDSPTPIIDTRTRLSASQQKVARRLSIGAGARGILMMVIGTVIDVWFPTPGRNSFGTVFGLFMLLVYGARFAYLRGISDERAETGSRDHTFKANHAMQRTAR